MFRIAIMAAGALALTTGAASALEASKAEVIKAPPAKVWAAIGDFCGIAQWHPAITGCKLSMDGRTRLRTLSLKGGGTIVERQLKRSNKTMSYSYAIVSSPLPVTNYISTISVAPGDGGSIVTWSGTFDAKEVDDAKATAAIQGIYDSGLDALAAKLQ